MQSTQRTLDKAEMGQGANTSPEGNGFGIGIGKDGVNAFSHTNDLESDKRHHTTIRMGLGIFALCFLAYTFREPIAEVIKQIPKHK